MVVAVMATGCGHPAEPLLNGPPNRRSGALQGADYRCGVFARILVVEDDPDLRALLVQGLREEGHEVTEARDGAGALRAAVGEPDAVILDIGLPDADGRDVCLALRARGLAAPVIFLTARDAVPDVLSGFSAGGDDYVSKPFALAEVLARLQALLRRAGTGGARAVGELRLDPAAHALLGEDVRIELTPTEFRLLAALAATPGDVARRRDLVRAGWTEGAIVHDNTLDVYLARLRRKLRGVAGAPRIETVHGVGYRLA
jgi:DNA-binding response OmpR family regulator